MNINELRRKEANLRKTHDALKSIAEKYMNRAHETAAKADRLLATINSYESNTAPKSRNPGALPDLSRIHYVVSYNDNNEIVSIIPCHSETEFYATFHAQARRFPYVEGV